MNDDFNINLNVSFYNFLSSGNIDKHPLLGNGLNL